MIPGSPWITASWWMTLLAAEQKTPARRILPFFPISVSCGGQGAKLATQRAFCVRRLVA